MKVIRDSIHKDIYLSEDELKVVDSEEFQRLRNIKQTGLTYLVYPSANHTRFEHSLGTMFIASKIAEKIGVDVELTRVSALLHDIGHPPFSHTLEICGYNHEKFGKKKIKQMELDNFSKNEIIKTLNRRNLEGKIISGDVDADRMDYLLRDSYHTGTAYGMIDLPRILRSITTFESFGNIKIGILKKGIQAIESLLVARHQMYSAVYMHPTVRIADTMMKRAVIKEIKEGNLNIKDLSNMDDIALVSFLRNSENYLMKRIDKRNLYKNLITYSYFDLNPIEKWIFINLDEKQILSLENRFYEKFGCDIFIDIYPIPKMEEHNIYIISDEGVKRLDEVSPLAQSLKPSEMRLWNVSIYAPKEKIKELKESDIKDKINKILNEFDAKIESKLIDILKEHGKIIGKRRFLEIAKERGVSPREFYSELHKLIFCGLIKERFNGKKYSYCLNSFVKFK
ncbi:HD domain-containing protein [Methanocaldococcus fervens]|uniref:Metal dependent phosphohydrolase n=1 Tax=Methanocaldococcus fervens (strain DSM 4213 / JCM 15782 / AG86) TaxID=573064 RepID=C7P7P1_METFA|nr:HD domain-containing protein [Methanocaldococcus fervens]ACV24573.1 metal dependent phosphohydrolase [Methanocaldococcus fervens AG86]